MQKDGELILGIISTVGLDTAEILGCIRDGLEQFKYSAVEIKVSSSILGQFEKETPSFPNEFDRISHYMDLGNKVRKETKDASILMKGVVAYIYEKFIFQDDEKGSPKSRTAYIINSIKHPEEVNFLRQVYGDGFHLIGISDNYENRMKYLEKRKHLPKEKAENLLSRDYDEDQADGQHTQDAYQKADYFINMADGKAKNQESIFRLLDLLFGAPFITPTFSEYAMFRAYVASLRSADLSRQIGAVVADDKTKEIIAEGVNDCPRASGGLYWPIYNDDADEYDDEEFGRDYKVGYDSNKIEQKRIIDNILKSLGMESTDENVKKVKSSGIGTLTEYGRVVHSEMEALLMCARNNISARERSMYVTTFPCHNCAKHIIAAGVKKVVYIEPYPKSKALEFYRNEISQNETDVDKVRFIPFKGVGPHRFVDLFSMESTRWYARTRKRSDGHVIEWERPTANLRNPMLLFNYIEFERMAYRQYQDEIQGLREEN